MKSSSSRFTTKNRIQAFSRQHLMKSWNSLLEDTGGIISTAGFKSQLQGTVREVHQRIMSKNTVFGSGKPHFTACLKVKWHPCLIPLFLQFSSSTHSSLLADKLGGPLIWPAGTVNALNTLKSKSSMEWDCCPPWQAELGSILLFKLIFIECYYPKSLLVYRIPLPGKKKEQKKKEQKTLKYKVHHHIIIQIYLTHSWSSQLQREPHAGITQI